MVQIERKTVSPVLDATGSVSAAGWARGTVFQFDSNLDWISRLFFSASDKYVVFSPTHTFCFEAFDGGSIGYTRAALFSLRDRRQFQNTVTVFFPYGSFGISAASEDKSIALRPQKNVFDFIIRKNGVRIIRIDIPAFGHERSLRGELVLKEGGGAKKNESLVVAAGYPAYKRRFMVTKVSPWYTVEGVMQFESSDIVFSRNNGFGIYEWKRVVRPPRDEHWWAAACGQRDGKLIGLSVGYGSVDARSATENAFFIEGKIHKLGYVSIRVSLSDNLSPWNFKSDDGRLEATFVPRGEFVHQAAIFFFKRKTRQFFGFFSGSFTLEDGKIITFASLSGAAELRRTRL